MTDPSVNIGAIGEYLDLIYPSAYDWTGLIAASHSTPDGRGMPSASWPRGQAESGLIDFAGAAQRRAAPGVYLRCSTVRAGLGEGKRGGRRDSVELPGLWADIDIAGPGHKHDPAQHDGRRLPIDVDEALTVIERSALPAPTVIVHSGGGLYAWWLTDRPIRLTEEGEGYERWAAISAWWQQQLHEGACVVGRHYGTGVGNLDRVLGVVGTANVKLPDRPRLRVLLSADGPRYAPEHLSAQYDAAAPAQRRVTPATLAAPTHAHTDERVPLAPSSVRPPGHLSPLDELELRHSWADILHPHGWECVTGDPQIGGYCEWRRPGASHPISATTGRDEGRDRLYVFSDMAGLPTHEPLTKGYVYAALWHSGDMSRAARALMDRGYGSTAQRSASGERARQPQGGEEGEESEGRRLELVPASAMRMRATRWLWAEEEVGAQWLPLGGIALLGGREGRGKTTWTYRLIAELTTGTLRGDLYGQRRSAVIAATEDDWEATIVPRLHSAGADLDRVYRIDVVEPDSRTGVSLPEDLIALGRLLAERDDVALLVLDPIITILSARADSHKDHEVRRALEPLAHIAHSFSVTVLGLIHDNKSTGTDLSTRLMGSRAFVAVARAALVCLEEGDAPEEGQADTLGADPVQVCDSDAPLSPGQVTRSSLTFLLGQVKSNLGPKAPWSIRYQITSLVVGHDDEVDKDIVGSRIVRTGRRTEQLEDSARRIERGHDASAPRGEASSALLAELEDGEEHASAEVKDRLIEDGHALRTIKRAVTALVEEGGISITKRGRETFWTRVSPPSSQDSGPGGPGGPSGPGGPGGPDGPGYDEGTEGDEDAMRATRATGQVPPRARARVARIDGPLSCSCPEGDHVPWCPSHDRASA